MLKYHLSFPISPEQYFLYLTTIVHIDSKRHYRRWIEETHFSGYYFYGNVTRNSFRVVPIIGGRNYFTPIFVGNYDGTETTAIQMRMVSSPDLIATLAFFSLFLLTNLIEFLINPGLFQLSELPPLAMGWLILLVLLILDKRTKKKIFARYSSYLSSQNPNASDSPK